MTSGTELPIANSVKPITVSGMWKVSPVGIATCTLSVTFYLVLIDVGVSNVQVALHIRVCVCVCVCVSVSECVGAVCV